MTRKIAIVGCAESSRAGAPYNDPSWEIWTLNDMFAIAPRIDRFFELHRWETVIPAEQEWLKQNESIPSYMMFQYDWVPSFTQFPHEVIVKNFGRYFTNSISWMIALAVHEGTDAIGIWGVDMAHGTEYAHQRPSCEYMIGVAMGKGIEVHIPPISDLLTTAELYGLEMSPMTLNLDNRYENLLKMRDLQTAIKVAAIENEARCNGGLEMLSYVRAAWINR